jgi:hypothetical protein
LAGHLAQFFIDHGEQFGSRPGVPLLNGLKNAGNFGHINNMPKAPRNQMKKWNI